MSEQSQTSSETPVENKLCKMGCGFFGNGATGDCCSKCWRELQKKNEVPATAPAVQQPPQCLPVAAAQEEPTPMEVDTPVPAKEEAPKVEEKPKPTSTTPKKKKKKASYKNMMKGMMQSNSPGRDVQKEKDALRKVTGGGAFSKIDKI